MSDDPKHEVPLDEPLWAALLRTNPEVALVCTRLSIRFLDNTDYGCAAMKVQIGGGKSPLQVVSGWKADEVPNGGANQDLMEVARALFSGLFPWLLKSGGYKSDSEQDPERIACLRALGMEGMEALRRILSGGQQFWAPAKAADWLLAAGTNDRADGRMTEGGRERDTQHGD